MAQKGLLKKRIILISIPSLVAILVYFCIRLAASNPDFVENYYTRGIYPVISRFISMVSNMVSFSLWDFTWIMIIILVLTGLVLVFLRRMKLMHYLFLLAGMALTFYSFFYLTWGFNYFRPAIEQRLSWQKTIPDEKAFREVLGMLIENVNKTHSELKTDDYPSIDNLLEESYSNIGERIGVDYPNGFRRPKTIFLSSYFAKSGVSGYFGPFFNEVHINSYQLPLDYPFVLAHEKAHQFGIANEAEANLAAFVVCTASDDIRLQYSGYLHVLLYFMGDARQLDDYQEFLKQIDRPVLRDIRFRERYYRKLRNSKLEKMQSAANDAYLKTQKIGSGINNYNQVVGLIIKWYKNSPGSQGS